MKLPALQQQRNALERAAGREYFAFHMEQGTGKTYVVLAEAEALYAERKVALLVIIAPNGVHRNWLRVEAPKLLSAPYRAYAWDSADTKKAARERDEFLRAPNFTQLKIATFNIEAFSMPKSRAERYLNALLSAHRDLTLVAVDEASTIKNVNAKRTKNVWKFRAAARYRRILTGTSVTTSPLNLYGQAKFLHDSLLGFKDYTPFKAYYAEWREKTLTTNRIGPDGKRIVASHPELVRYRHLDELKRRADAYSYTVTKAECLDLPPKVYEERLVVLGARQRGIYASAVKQFIVQLSADERMTMSHAMTRLVRLAQIAGGFVKPDDAEEAEPIPGENAKLESLLTALEEIDPDRKVIIWARFTPELRLIVNTLGAENCVTYWGETARDERAENVDRFQNDDRVRYFVGNTQSGKFGFTLTAATHMIYFSKDFSPEARWQSEDRAHRIGQRNELTITDLLAENTVDHLIHAVLMGHKTLADFFKGDRRAGLIKLLEEQL